MLYIKKSDLIVLPSLYLVLCLLLYTFQRSLLYFPDVTEVYNSQVWQTVKVGNKIIALESKDDFKKTIVLFHGNATNAAHQVFYHNFFPKDVHLIVMEYPGYGLNHKMDITQDNVMKSAREVMNYAKNKYSNNIILTGESLGSGIASTMAVEFNIKKLFLITPYTTIGEVAESKFWYVPVSLLLKDNYDNINTLKKYKGEVFVLISEKDKVVPAKYGKKLYSSLNMKKEEIFIKNAGHSNWNEFIKDEQLQQLRKFISF